MYKLYFFNPSFVQVEGYSFVGSFDSEQDCNNEAFAKGQNYFRIEFQTELGSTLIYETVEY